MDHLWLRIPYALNILILVPVCGALLAANGAAVFQGAAAASRGVEMLVASLWLGVLAASAVGLAFPQPLAPLLVFQIFYKAVWLALYVAPAMARGEPYPTGVAATFAFIVATWPAFLWLAYR
ncbi:MAG: hypothetical protein GC206_00730 [Alphaproteobacteria bacterium]|nr:hypothetical protein [Alphaproteobacteria bacterium]